MIEKEERDKREVHAITIFLLPCFVTFIEFKFFYFSLFHIHETLDDQLWLRSLMTKLGVRHTVY